MADEETPAPVTKPGYKTTEFWITVVVALTGLAMASGAIHEGSGWDKAIGLIASTLAAMGYSASRGNVKSNQ